MVDDEVLLLDGEEAIAAIVAHALGKTRGIGGELEIGPRQADDLGQILHRQHAVERDDLLGLDVEFLGDEGAQVRRHMGVGLQPDHRAAPAPLERGLEQAHEILGLFLDFQIAVADHAERALRLDRIAGEQFLDMGQNDRVEQHQPRAARRRVRQADEAVDLARHAHQRLHARAGDGMDEIERQRQPEIGDEGERMGRIDRQRRQDRKDVQEEMIVQPQPLGLVELGGIDEDDMLGLQIVLQLAPQPDLLLGEFGNPRADQRQLFGRGQAVVRERLDAAAQLAADARDPDHEEFVEVIGRDRDEADPLEQRMGRIGGLQQDAAVELQPRQFAIDETLRRMAQGVAAERLDRRYGRDVPCFPSIP